MRMQEIFEEADEDGGGGLDIDEFKGQSVNHQKFNDKRSETKQIYGR